MNLLQGVLDLLSEKIVQSAPITIKLNDMLQTGKPYKVHHSNKPNDIIDKGQGNRTKIAPITQQTGQYFQTEQKLVGQFVQDRTKGIYSK